MIYSFLLEDFRAKQKLCFKDIYLYMSFKIFVNLERSCKVMCSLYVKGRSCIDHVRLGAMDTDPKQIIVNTEVEEYSNNLMYTYNINVTQTDRCLSKEDML